MDEYSESMLELVYDIPPPLCGHTDMKPCPPDDALVECVNTFGRVDADFISTRTGRSPYILLTHDLRGAVFQDPALFAEGEAWTPDKGWRLREQYLHGNIIRKLKEAKEANSRFPKRFQANIEALEQLLPNAPEPQEIHVSLGATWVPASLYEEFIQDLLHLSQRPSLTYIRSISQWSLQLRDRQTHTVRSRNVFGTAELPADRIIEQTMNARTVKVYEERLLPDGRIQYIVNQEKTLEAQEKQKLILRYFDEWIFHTESRKKAVQEHYCNAFAGNIGPQFDGTFLRFPDMAAGIRLYPRQRNAIARILLSDSNVLLAHPVGAGKTFVMIGAVHELWRMGLSQKNMIVVPNSILQATVGQHRRLYPNDKLLVVYPKDFSPAKRDETLRRIKEEDNICTYIAFSSFDKIVMSKSYWLNKYKRELETLQRAAEKSSDPKVRRTLEAKAEKQKKQLAKYVTEAEECPWLTFDNLGVNTLFVDEAHNYKNIQIDTKTDGIVGMHVRGSKKCTEMLEKCRSVDRLIFATGTPLTNSLADLFVMQLYLQPEELRFRKIDSFDMWLNTFGERETNYEVDVDAQHLRPITRFSAFHNLTELMSLFSWVCDFVSVDEDSGQRPLFKGYSDVSVPKSAPQTRYIQYLAQRTELIRTHKVKPTEDNLLKVTVQGRACALDIRLVNRHEAGIPFSGQDVACSKVHACANRIWSLYKRYPGTCQVVFSDIGTPKDGFNVYDELKRELMVSGLPAWEIAFVHDADSESDRDALFRDINRGTVRVVVASTPKLGIGVNVQEKLIALHHLSVPWRPADMVQREGRILRCGNTCEQVFIYRYVTEGSFDSYSWQLLENKQRFISSFLSGTAAVRDQEDIADAVLSYAEVKALAIGNPLIKKRVVTANRLERKRIAFRQRQKELTQLKAIRDRYPEKRQKLNRLQERILSDAAYYRQERMTVSLEERRAFGEELKEALAQNNQCSKERIFDTYCGFDIILPEDMDREHPYVLVRGQSGSDYYLDMPETKVLGYSRRIDNLLDKLPDRASNVSSQQKIEEKQYQDAIAEIDRGNSYGEEIDRLVQELDELDRQLEDRKEETA